MRKCELPTSIPLSTAASKAVIYKKYWLKGSWNQIICVFLFLEKGKIMKTIDHKPSRYERKYENN